VRLQEAAKRVASGDVHAPLQMRSSIREIRELNLHLERMRQELVGTNEQLSREIRERKVSEEKRLALERRLLHRERIAAIGTLAGGVAHEFNNIMTPILLYSQLALEEAAADSALAQDLSRVVAAAHRARSLVTRILTFSREMDSREAGQFSAGTPVAEALALLRAIVPTNIEIHFNPSQKDITMYGDPSLVQQIVINLCTNAYQAMRGSGGKLSVSLKVADGPENTHLKDNRCCVLEVADTGHGIEATLLAHIFEPFFTTREVGEGTGLGLSVVHGIVESMGGEILVESQRGLGTVFRVYLPLAAEKVGLAAGA
jgi:two-component system, cell cycle sensor histidine kinase and response regulator CckA